MEGVGKKTQKTHGVIKILQDENNITKISDVSDKKSHY
jgi:hypothetical protein